MHAITDKVQIAKWVHEHVLHGPEVYVEVQDDLRLRWVRVHNDKVRDCSVGTKLVLRVRDEPVLVDCTYNTTDVVFTEVRVNGTVQHPENLPITRKLYLAGNATIPRGKALKNVHVHNCLRTFTDAQGLFHPRAENVKLVVNRGYGQQAKYQLNLDFRDLSTPVSVTLQHCAVQNLRMLHGEDLVLVDGSSVQNLEAQSLQRLNLQYCELQELHLEDKQLQLLQLHVHSHHEPLKPFKGVTIQEVKLWGEVNCAGLEALRPKKVIIKNPNGTLGFKGCAELAGLINVLYCAGENQPARVLQARLEKIRAGDFDELLKLQEELVEAD